MDPKVTEALRRALESNELIVRPEDEFRAYDGWDSLAAISLVAELDDLCDVTIDSEEFRALRTVEELAEAVSRKRASGKPAEVR